MPTTRPSWTSRPASAADLVRFGDRRSRRTYAHITRDSARQAERVVRTITRAAEGLVTLPFVGHMSKDVEGTRERPLSHWNYSLIYRVIADRRPQGEGAEVEILRVLGPGQQRPQT